MDASRQVQGTVTRLPPAVAFANLMAVADIMSHYCLLTVYGSVYYLGSHLLGHLGKYSTVGRFYTVRCCMPSFPPFTEPFQGGSTLLSA
jgi:hypothetical protein